MSRPIRIQYPGAVYHVMSRGNGGNKIFNDKQDYQNFLIVFSEVLKRYNWISYAYCLMPNHYHILIQTVDPNLSIGMRHLNGRYTQKFNIRHKRFGHIFQGRFKSILVDMDHYRYQLVRYIVLNPVKARLVNNFNDWQWSSHLEMTGKLKEPSECLNLVKAQRLFGYRKQEAINTYWKYIHQKIEGQDSDIEFESGTILGSDSFIERIANYFKGKEKLSEVPIIERFAHRPNLQLHFGDKDLDKKNRNKLIKQAYFDYGYTLSAIGKQLNLHYTTISAIVNVNKKNT